MADLVRDHIRLREVAGRAEALAQLVVEAEVDVYLLILGAVERATGRSREAACRLDGVAEEIELGVAVARQGLIPRRLRVVEDEGDELDRAMLLRRLLHRPARLRRGAAAAAAVEKREEVLVEEKAENEQEDGTAAPDRRAADAKAAAAAAATVFNVRGEATGCPAHAAVCSTRDANWSGVGPGDPIHLFEVSVERQQLGAGFHGVGRDPDVVGWDRTSLAAKRGCDAAKAIGRNESDGKKSDVGVFD